MQQDPLIHAARPPAAIPTRPGLGTPARITVLAFWIALAAGPFLWLYLVAPSILGRLREDGRAVPAILQRLVSIYFFMRRGEFWWLSVPALGALAACGIRLSRGWVIAVTLALLLASAAGFATIILGFWMAYA